MRIYKDNQLTVLKLSVFSFKKTHYEKDEALFNAFFYSVPTNDELVVVLMLFEERDDEEKV